MAKFTKKNRAIVSGIFVGLASIFAVASNFDVPMGELVGFMVTTLIFFGAIVLLAGLAVLLFKLLGRLLRGKAENNHIQQPQSEANDKE